MQVAKLSPIRLIIYKMEVSNACLMWFCVEVKEAAFWEDLTVWLHLVLAKVVVVNS